MQPRQSGVIHGACVAHHTVRKQRIHDAKHALQARRSLPTMGRWSMMSGHCTYDRSGLLPFYSVQCPVALQVLATGHVCRYWLQRMFERSTTFTQYRTADPLLMRSLSRRCCTTSLHVYGPVLGPRDRPDFHFARNEFAPDSYFVLHPHPPLVIQRSEATKDRTSNCVPRVTPVVIQTSAARKDLTD